MGIIIFLELYKHFGIYSWRRHKCAKQQHQIFFLFLVKTLKDQLHLLVIVEVV